MSHRERRGLATGWVVGGTWVPWNSQRSLRLKWGHWQPWGFWSIVGTVSMILSHITHSMAIMICFLKHSAESPDNGGMSVRKSGPNKTSGYRTPTFSPNLQAGSHLPRRALSGAQGGRGHLWKAGTGHLQKQESPEALLPLFPRGVQVTP